MAIDRKQFSKADQQFFKNFDAWRLGPGPLPNLLRDNISPDEFKIKARRFPQLLVDELARAEKKLDLSLDWDKLIGPTLKKMNAASHFHLFLQDKRALGWAMEALESFESCKRPHFTWSTCLGVMDLDLRSAHVIESLRWMIGSFGELLDASTRKRIDDLLLKRLLRPGLIAMQTKKYPWMYSKANWRVILCGQLAMGAMLLADRYDDYRQTIEFGIEGMLATLSTGDGEGGWNEGPGYWEYGMSHAVALAWVMRTFTGGQVDFFQHRFLRKTGDFYLCMHTRHDAIWNWSDCGKTIGASIPLTALARAYQNPAYQRLVLAEGVTTFDQLYYFDPALPHSKSAAAAAAPLIKHFPGPGVIVSRTGFEDTDTFVGVKAGDIPEFNHHSHMDAGSVVIHAAGRELLAEPDGYSYPREGPKDPKAPRPKHPGNYDEELHRWKRWDMDQISALGHNVPILEGQYPQPVLLVPPKMNILHHDDHYDVVAVDSTPYYRPLATRMRRLVIFLRPNMVILVDDMTATRPVRARLNFHYCKEAAIERHNFRITNGPAQMLISPLSPTEDDNLVVGRDDRRTFYEPPTGLVETHCQYVYVENLWRKKRMVFVTAMQFGPRNLLKTEPATFTLEGDPVKDGKFAVAIQQGTHTGKISVDVAKQKVTVR